MPNSINAGPAALEQASQVFAVILTFVESLCTTNTDLTETCMRAERALIHFGQRVAEWCRSSAAVQSTCSGGITLSSVSKVLLADLASGKFDASLSEDAWSTAAENAVRRLFEIKPAKGVGMSEASAVLAISDDPAALFVVLQPPESVTVGEVFEVKVALTIATGAALPFKAVIASIANAEGGAAVDVESFIAEAQASIAADEDPWLVPILEKERRTAYTDTFGEATFSLRITSAPTGDYTLDFTSGDAKSSSSVTFRVVNSVHRSVLEGDEGFDARIGIAGEAYFVAPSFPFDFTPFVPTVTPFNEDDQPLGNRTVAAFVISAEAGVDPYADAEEADDNQGQGGSNARDSSASVAVLFADLPPSEKFTLMFKLVAQDSRKFTIGGSGANGQVFLGRPQFGAQAGAVVFDDMVLQVRAAGEYRIVFAVDGVPTRASSIIHVMTSEDQRDLRRWFDLAMKFIICFACGVVMLGNSAFHHKVFIVSSVVLLGAAIVATPFILEGQEDTAGTEVALFLAFSTAIFGLLYVGVMETLKKTHLLFPQQRRAAFFRYVRELWKAPPEAHVDADDAGVGDKAAGVVPLCAYCEERAAELSCLACRVVFCGECSNTVHQGRLSAHAVVNGTAIEEETAVGSLEAATRRAKRKAAASEKERSLLYQFKACCRSIIWQDTSEAFFYPSKVFSAFVVSILATSILGVMVLNYISATQRFVKSSDARALRTVLAGIGSLEDLFFKTFGSDIFASLLGRRRVSRTTKPIGCSTTSARPCSSAWCWACSAASSHSLCHGSSSSPTSASRCCRHGAAYGKSTARSCASATAPTTWASRSAT